jgi:hypothetical protein
MRVETSTVTKLTISEIVGLDPVCVILENFGPSRGQITVSCYGKSWTAFFGGCGDDGIASFIASVSADYLADKMHHGAREEWYMDKAKDDAARSILEQRKRRDYSKQDARRLWNELESWPQNQQEAWAASARMQAVLGDEWWYAIPTRITHEYAYLLRVVEAAQAGIRSTLTTTQEQPA